MSTLPYWRDDSPFMRGTVIRSLPMNTKLGGISVNLQQITAQINGFAIKLPDTFIGDTQIPNKPYTDSLLYINKDGNADLIPRGNIVADGSIELDLISKSDQAFSVDGNNHNEFITCDYAGAASEKIIINVGKGIRNFEGNNIVVPGSTIFFTSASDAELWLAPDTAEGVTIISPGTLKAYGKHSTIAIMSLNETTWLMMGDINPSDGAIP